MPHLETTQNWSQLCVNWILSRIISKASGTSVLDKANTCYSSSYQPSDYHKVQQSTPQHLYYHNMHSLLRSYDATTWEITNPSYWLLRVFPRQWYPWHSGERVPGLQLALYSSLTPQGCCKSHETRCVRVPPHRIFYYQVDLPWPESAQCRLWQHKGSWLEMFCQNCFISLLLYHALFRSLAVLGRRKTPVA